MIAAVIADAMSWFGASYPRERPVRQERLALYKEQHPDARSPFERQDDRFYKLIRSENGGFVAAANEFAAGSRG